MARRIERLSALAVGRLKHPGLHADGGGLYLHVSKSGARSWIFRYRMAGRKTPRDFGLGSLSTIGLAEARQRARDARKLLLDGRDPIATRRVAKAANQADAARAISFDQSAERYVAAHSAGWRNEKHAAQWASTLKTYASPVFGSLSVAAIDTKLVLKALEPIWKEKPETASRLRGRIEAILDWATARGYRTGDNPARWRGALQSLLAAPNKIRPVVHHPALPYSEIGTFMEALRSQTGIGALALEFAILTATRTSETIGATWSEIDFDRAIWTIPGSRIKTGKEHRVPLSDPAKAVLRHIRKAAIGEFVFSGSKSGKPLSNMALLAVLKRMKRSDLTTHGFRSTFRDWAAERTNYPREVAEMALAHAVGDKVEAAYRRGDLFEKRKRLLAEWAKCCATVEKQGEVVAIRRG